MTLSVVPNKRLTPRRVKPLLAGTAVLALLAGCSGGGFDDDPSNESGEDNGQTEGEAPSSALTSSDDPITVLIGSSGDAETAAVEDAVAQWAETSGVEASVQVAADLNQELSQGFAGGKPADVFYLSSELLPGFAENGSVQAYGDLLENRDDFFTPLVENFTFDEEFYCAPKDFSTLALIINDQALQDAGLSEEDYPSTWQELEDVSEQLAQEYDTGLAFGAEYQRVGVFLAQAGGGLIQDGEVIANSAGSVEGLEFVKTNIENSNFAFAADIGSGWGGEALGTEAAPMVIEGNWVTGAMTNDYPDIDYTVVELPAGPDGQGTLQFTNCWGLAADSPNQQAAVELIEFLTSPQQQMEFSDAFGPMPSVESAKDEWKEANPELSAFMDGADYVQLIPAINGIQDVISDFNTQLESLADSDPQGIVDSVQENLEAIND